MVGARRAVRRDWAPRRRAKIYAGSPRRPASQEPSQPALAAADQNTLDLREALALDRPGIT